MSRLVKRAAEAAERAVDNVVDDNVFDDDDVSLFHFLPLSLCLLTNELTNHRTDHRMDHCVSTG